MNALFSWFERRINPYPDQMMPVPGNSLWSFVSSCLIGTRRWLALLVLLVALVGVLEALLFQWMGFVVDWINKYTPETLLAEKGWAMTAMIVVMALSPLLILMSSAVRFQSLQGVLPMRMRWRFHRLMMSQSLAFYQDEFAGRVSAKVMQSALAVRDAVMTCADMITYILVYFVTGSVVLWQFD
ncbi:MAG: multidrug ABC transporter ATP-binding protein, partial [Lautropia sp.]|nr:multidrug ABC transporter ATP-binding protein [Lautropia sp.]